MLKIDKINMLLFLMLFNFKVIYFLLRSYLLSLFNFVIYSILFFYIYLYLMCNDLKINFIIKM